MMVEEFDDGIDSVVKNLRLRESFHWAVVNDIVKGDSSIEQELIVQGQIRMLTDILCALQENDIPVNYYLERV